MEIHTVKQKLLSAMPASTPEGAERLAKAYLTLCEAQYIELETQLYAEMSENVEYVEAPGH